jgi:hypothetical protein
VADAHTNFKLIGITTMTINYYSKEVYGQTMFYLATAEARTKWQLLSGKKTITEYDMTRLSKLTGVEFVRVFEAIS